MTPLPEDRRSIRMFARSVLDFSRSMPKVPRPVVGGPVVGGPPVVLPLVTAGFAAC